MACRLAALVLAALLAGGARSRADDAAPLDEHTALMVGGGKIKLGLLSLDYGFTDRLSIGVDAPAWVAGAFSTVFVPNLHLKGTLLVRPTWVVSGLVGVYYANLDRDGAGTGGLLAVPATLFGSLAVTPHLSVHGELNYNWVRGFGSGDLRKGEVDGAVATRSGQVGLMADYHFTRVFALVARGRYQVQTSPLVLHGDGTLDAFTDVDLAAEVHPAHPHPWMAVGGVALTWTHVVLVLGGGYGTFFIPGANLAIRGRGFVPEGSFWVRF